MPLFGSFATHGKSKATFPGIPGTPSIVSESSGQVALSWTAPSFNGGAPLLDYRVEYSSNGGSSWTTASRTPSTTTSQLVTGLPDFLTYIFRISAINAVGAGTPSANSSQVLQFNDATGGSISTVSNYNGTGQTWRVHEFSSVGTSTFTVTRSKTSFRVYIGAGNGGGGSSGCCGGCSSTGQHGGFYTDDNTSLVAQAYSVVVGGGGAGGTWTSGAAQAGSNDPGSPGGNSSFAGVTRFGGAGGPIAPGPFAVSNIRGSGNQNIGQQTWGSACGDGVSGSPGNSGRVIVAYRIS